MPHRIRMHIARRAQAHHKHHVSMLHSSAWTLFTRPMHPRCTLHHLWYTRRIHTTLNLHSFYIHTPNMSYIFHTHVLRTLHMHRALTTHMPHAGSTPPTCKHSCMRRHTTPWRLQACCTCTMYARSTRATLKLHTCRTRTAPTNATHA
jgi:hypothetical protein